LPGTADLGVVLPTQGRDPDPDFLVDFAVEAETLGFASLWVPDHVLRVFGPILDPVVALSFVAAATREIGLGTSVLVAPYRHPVHLANELATLDVLCGGRLCVGLGIGWARKEFEALGIPHTERGRRTDEILESLVRLWGGGPASYEGEFYAFEGVELGTTPRTNGGPRLLIGGKSEAALRRTLRFGAGWNGFGDAPEDIRDVRRRIARLGDELGRNPGALQISTSYDLTRRDAEAAADGIGALRDAGADLCILALGSPEPGALAWVAEEVAPRL
jgi:probable F420-dependent oxidoreductase